MQWRLNACLNTCGFKLDMGSLADLVFHGYTVLFMSPDLILRISMLLVHTHALRASIIGSLAMLRGGWPWAKGKGPLYV